MSGFLSHGLVPIAIGAVAVVLLLGLVNMMRGGSANSSQKLMRLRVLLQFVAIVIIMFTIWVMVEITRANMVVLNKIYTRTGDDGTTALGTGERRKKYDLRVAAYGTLDEANAAIGIARLHTGGEPRSMARWRASRTICSTSAPILPRRARARGRAARGSPSTAAQVTWLEKRDRPAQCRARAAAILRPAGRLSRRRHICISPAPYAGAPSG